MPALAPMRIDGPPPEPPLYGLTTTPGTIIEQGDPHWMGGVLVDSYPDELPSAHDPCSSGSARIKAVGDEPPHPEFSSYSLYLPITCSGMGIGDLAGAERLRRIATEVMVAVESYGVERELAFAEAASDRPHLTDSNLVTPMGVNGVSPREGLSLLEKWIGMSARRGFLHIDPATFDGMPGDKFVSDGRTMRTQRGNTVIIGDGYIGAVPDAEEIDEEEVSDLAPDHNWIFATGPVRVSRDSVEVPGLEDVFNHEDNSLTFRAERNYVAYWDTAVQYGVLVDRSATP